MTAVRCRNCSAPINHVGVQLPKVSGAVEALDERDTLRIRLHCSNCQTQYVVEIDIDEFEAEDLRLPRSNPS